MAIATVQPKTDEELREQIDRLRKRIRNAKAEDPRNAELANCMLGILDLLADAGL